MLPVGSLGSARMPAHSIAATPTTRAATPGETRSRPSAAVGGAWHPAMPQLEGKSCVGTSGHAAAPPPPLPVRKRASSFSVPGQPASSSPPRSTIPAAYARRRSVDIGCPDVNAEHLVERAAGDVGVARLRIEGREPAHVVHPDPRLEARGDHHREPAPEIDAADARAAEALVHLARREGAEVARVHQD